MLSRPQRKELYSSQRVGRERTRFSYVDTLFSLPEVTLYAAVVDLIDTQPEVWGPSGPPDYASAWTAVRAAIDESHQDDTIKSRIKANVAAYFDKDPDLGPALHKLRSAGKKLFLLTNSLYGYTETVMSYILGGDDDVYEDWTGYFDWIIVGSRKPAFFTGSEGFWPIDRETGVKTSKPVAEPVKHRIYEGGNQIGLQRALGVSPDGSCTSVITSTAISCRARRLRLADRADRRRAWSGAGAVIRSRSRIRSLSISGNSHEDVSDQRYLQRGLKLLVSEAVVPSIRCATMS
jgi:HAD superfamily 5'-nucleotidase-like hydrolase